MQNAIITGLVGNDSVPNRVSGTCPSANCTWDMYSSLAFCSDVRDVTSTLVQYCIEDQQTIETGLGEGIGSTVPFNMTCNVSTSKDRSNLTSPAANLGMSYYFERNELGPFDGLFDVVEGQYITPDIFKMNVLYMQQESGQTNGPGEDWTHVGRSYMPPAGKLAFEANVTICLQRFETTMTNGSIDAVLHESVVSTDWREEDDESI